MPILTSIITVAYDPVLPNRADAAMLARVGSRAWVHVAAVVDSHLAYHTFCVYYVSKK